MGTEAVLMAMTTEDAMQALRTHDVPAQAVNHPRNKVLTDKQVEHNKLTFEYDHPHTPTGRVRNARPAAQFTGSQFELRHPAPLLGEHTKEVLIEIGFNATEVQELHDQKV